MKRITPVLLLLLAGCATSPTPPTLQLDPGPRYCPVISHWIHNLDRPDPPPLLLPDASGLQLP